MNSDQIEIEKFQREPEEEKYWNWDKEVLYTGESLDKLDYGVINEAGEKIDYQEFLDYIRRNEEEEQIRLNTNLLNKIYYQEFLDYIMRNEEEEQRRLNTELVNKLVKALKSGKILSNLSESELLEIFHHK